MNVLAMILADHQRVLGIIQDLESTRDHRFREDMSDLLRREATLHMNAEERVFYPALAPFLPDGVTMSIEQHHLARFSLNSLVNSSKDNPGWLSRLLVFRDITVNHMVQEEGPVFDTATRFLGENQPQKIGTHLPGGQGPQSP
jgi:hypothetical protein